MKNTDKKHTPGPWVATVNLEQDGEWSHIIDNHSYPIAGFPRLDICTGEGKANARLIAAAPEMLELLMLAVRELEWADKNCQIRPVAGVSTFKTAAVQIKSAIAKATGGVK